jgi:hypothetical protein
LNDALKGASVAASLSHFMMPMHTLRLPSRGQTTAMAVAAGLIGSLVYIHTAYGHGDVNGYHRYALAFWSGAQRLRALPAEYPPLALAPFTLTLVPPLPDFVSVFGLWMLLLLAAGWAAIRAFESSRAAQVTIVYLVLGGFGTVLARFDLFPAACVVVAYWAVRSGRFRLAYLLLALGTLLKLYPLLLLPVVVIEQWRRESGGGPRLPLPRPVLRGLGLFCAVVVVGLGVAAAMDPRGWLGFLVWNARRPLQVESVPASLLWLSGLAGLPTAPDRSFNSYNLVGLLGGGLSVLADLSLICGCVWVCWRQVQGRIAFARALTLATLVILCTNRVFSPQYLIWALPLIAITEGEYDLVWLVVCALTTLIFPFTYDWTDLHGHPVPHAYPAYFPALIAVRNGLLLVATARYARRSLAVAAAARLRFQPRRPSAA